MAIPIFNNTTFYYRKLIVFTAKEMCLLDVKRPYKNVQPEHSFSKPSTKTGFLQSSDRESFKFKFLQLLPLFKITEGSHMPFFILFGFSQLLS